MDALQIIALGLRPAVLTEEYVALNWYEDKGGFHLDTLPIDTIVLVDESGRAHYKYDCSNRLVVSAPGLSDRPSTSAMLPTTGATTPLPTTRYRRFENWLSRVWGRSAASLE